MAVWAKPEGTDTLVSVWVVPGASRTEVVGEHADALKIRVAAPPERGKANAAVARLLAGRTGCSVTLEHGSTTRIKRFRIRDLGPTDVAKRLMDS